MPSNLVIVYHRQPYEEVVENGKIVKMDVWNDSAERILTARGIEA